MDTGIVISIIFGAASIISSICFGLIPTIRKEKLKKLTEKTLKMNKDIKFFYNLEQTYIEELSKITGKNKETLKKEKRAQVEDAIGFPLSKYAKPSAFKQE